MTTKESTGTSGYEWAPKECCDYVDLIKPKTITIPVLPFQDFFLFFRLVGKFAIVDGRVDLDG